MEQARRATSDKPLTSTQPYGAAHYSGGFAVWRKALAKLQKVRERREGSRARSIGAAPIGLVVIVAIICVVVSVVSAAQRADDVELMQERKLLTHAIVDRGRRVLRELENVAASNDIVLQLHYNFDPDWVHHLVGLRLATFFDHDHVFVADRADKLTYAMRDNTSVDPARFDSVRARTRPHRRPAARPRAAARRRGRPSALHRRDHRSQSAAPRTAAADFHGPARDRRRRRRQSSRQRHASRPMPSRCCSP